jgi:class 3 adenylate cyclase/tetratricopeptide (TPR) repeat protein
MSGPPDSTQLEQIAAHLPSALVTRLSSTPLEDVPPLERIPGAVLLLDIAGFTPIVVSLSAAGARGIDMLQQLLTAYYTEIIEGALELGGIVYQFAGDSLLICFEQGPDESEGNVTLRAAASALRIQSRLARFRAVTLIDKNFRVTSRIGIGVGEFHRLLLGSARSWMHHVIVGAPLETAIAAQKPANGGEIFLTAEAWARLPERKQGSPRGGFWHLELLDEAQRVTIPVPALIRRDDAALVAQRCERLLNPILLSKARAGGAMFRGEFRDITCLFARFAIDEDRALVDDIEALSRFYEAVQAEVAHYGGTLMHPDFTDKGNVLFVAFGAPVAQEEQELLATRLAFRLTDLASRFPFLRPMRVGLATGRAYCGEVGAQARKSYTALGEVVNLASRVLSHGTASGVFIEGETERRLHGRFETELIDMARLKGVPRAVAIFNVRSAVRTDRHAAFVLQGDFIGRHDEFAKLWAQLERAFSGAGQIAIISGEAGVGKTRLATKLFEQAVPLGAVTVSGVCFSYEAFTPFFPWRALLTQLLELPELTSQSAWVEKLTSEVTALEGVSAEWVPVVASLFGVALAEGAATSTSTMDARGKNERLFQLVFDLLARRTRAAPIILFFEDVHWADRISLDLMDYVAARIGSLPIEFIVATRSVEAFENLLACPSCQTIELAPFSKDETRLFIRTRMNLEHTNLALENLIVGKVQGNPFFLESVVNGLLEQGYLAELQSGRRKLTQSVDDITIPESVHQVVLSRVDRLPDAEQALLKVASVVGRAFPVALVQALLPTPLDPPDLERALENLSRLEFIVLETKEPASYAFRHMMIRDVAYQTLLVSGRERLHHSLASALESVGSQERVSNAVLAYHFLAGDNLAKGFEYSVAAAHQARAQYANNDALHHYRKALDLAAAPRFQTEYPHLGPISQTKRAFAETLVQAANYREAIAVFEGCLSAATEPTERAEVHAGLGRVYQEKGEWHRAIEELELSLNLLGRRVPRNLVSLGLGIVWQSLLRLVQTLFPRRSPQAVAAAAPGAERELAALIALIKIYYFHDLVKLSWSAVLATNMSEGIASERLRGIALSYYGTLLFGSGFMNSAARHLVSAVESAKQSGEPLAEGITLSRLAIYTTFTNELERAIPLHREAAETFRKLGDMWELQLSLMMLATTHFLRSEFTRAHQLYEEMGLIGRQFNSQMHQGWAASWAPFCRYLQGRQSAASTRAELERAFEISRDVSDIANQCAAVNHLAVLAVREGDAEASAQTAKRGFRLLMKYQVLVPFLQCGLIDVADAAVYALEQKAGTVRPWVLRFIARICLFKVSILGRIYPYLRGPALRVRARFVALTKGLVQAEPLFLEAIEVLEKTQNVWETGLAYFDAAVALPMRRSEFALKAAEKLEQAGALRELERMDRLLGSANARDEPQTRAAG